MSINIMFNAMLFGKWFECDLFYISWHRGSFSIGFLSFSTEKNPLFSMFSFYYQPGGRVMLFLLWKKVYDNGLRILYEMENKK